MSPCPACAGTGYRLGAPSWVAGACETCEGERTILEAVAA